jgi:hypothetical protein
MLIKLFRRDVQEGKCQNQTGTIILRKSVDTRIKVNRTGDQAGSLQKGSGFLIAVQDPSARFETLYCTVNGDGEQRFSDRYPT